MIYSVILFNPEILPVVSSQPALSMQGPPRPQRPRQCPSEWRNIRARRCCEKLMISTQGISGKRVMNSFGRRAAASPMTVYFWSTALLSISFCSNSLKSCPSKIFQWLVPLPPYPPDTASQVAYTTSILESTESRMTGFKPSMGTRSTGRLKILIVPVAYGKR